MEPMMNQHAEIVDEADQLPSTDMADVNQSLAIGLTRAEIDQQIATARAYPRSLKAVTTRIMSLATLDDESAEECVYALPRGGKPIKGPSIRFAEIIKQAYGNCRAAARVVHVDRVEKYVEAEGVFHDLETNSATSARVRRRIVDKHGRLYTDDMIIVTGNAACSIALRNAILGAVPKPLWRRAYEAVQSAIAGDITTLTENRTKALKAFAMFGVKPETVLAALGVAGEEDVTVDHISVLRGMFSALKNGEETVESMFSTTVPGRSGHAKVENPLSDEAPIKGPVTETNGNRAEDRHAEKPAQAGAAGTGAPAADETEHSRPSPDSDERLNALEAMDDQALDGAAADVGETGESAATVSAAAPDPIDAGLPLGEPDEPAPNKVLLREFSQALQRADKVDSIDKLDDAFWEQKGIERPRKGDPDYGLTKQIYELHVIRARRRRPAEEIAAELERLLT